METIRLFTPTRSWSSHGLHDIWVHLRRELVCHFPFFVIFHTKQIWCNTGVFCDQVGQAVVVRPSQRCPSPHGCPIVLTMHGTGVPPEDQADAYKRWDKSLVSNNRWLYAGACGFLQFLQSLQFSQFLHWHVDSMIFSAQWNVVSQIYVHFLIQAKRKWVQSYQGFITM